MKNLNEFVYSSEVLEFVKIAKDFVDLLQDEMPEERRDFIGKSLLILPQMYANMMSIPPNEPEFDSGNQKHVT